MQQHTRRNPSPRYQRLLNLHCEEGKARIDKILTSVAAWLARRVTVS
jgi:hypothetical protein